MFIFSHSLSVNQFKCDICALAFRTLCERNMHILNHLEKSSCSICHETLVQIGNIWYGPHTHSGLENIIGARPVKSDEYETTAFANSIDDFQFDPLSTKIESFGDENAEQNNIEHITIDVVKNEEVAEIHDEPIETPKCDDDWSASKTNNKTKSGLGKASEKKRRPKQSEQNKLPKSIAPEIKRQKRSSTVVQKCWKCELCDAEFSFEANFIEHQEEHEKSSFQQDEPSFSVGTNATVECKSESSVDSLYVQSKSADPSVNPSVDDDDNLDLLKWGDIKNLTEVQLNSLQCPICNKKLNSQSGLKSHLRMHKTVYKCKLCTSLFPTMEEYRSHASLVHNITPKESQPEPPISDTSASDKKIVIDVINWICEYCNKDFEIEMNLAKHLLKDHGADQPEHMCNICTAKLSTPNDLLTHMRAHSESNQHRCSIDGCNNSFAYKSSLVIHLSKHKTFDCQLIVRKTQDDLSEVAKQYAAVSIENSTDLDLNDKKPLRCDACSKEFASRTTLLLHIHALHMNHQIPCAIDSCNETFHSVKSLRGHIKAYHPDAVHKCDVCKKFIYSKAKFHAHQLRHRNPSNPSDHSFACDVCMKTFPRKCELRSHFKKHDKNISCTLCDEKFSSIKVMMAHRERHGKKKTQTCRFENCNQVFDDRREFIKHASQHPVAGRKRFICPHCGKSISRSYIGDHINTHTKAVSYPCSYCDKSFIKKVTWRRHQLIHTNIKPYVCDVDECGKAYRESIDLKRHKFSVHKIYTKKHICSICEQVFPERKLLTKHTVNVHQKIDQTIPV